MIDDDFRSFIRELEQLTRKYLIIVDGCGCCGSPVLRKLEQNEVENQKSGYSINKYGEHLTWIDIKHKRHYWKEKIDNIIKE